MNRAFFSLQLVQTSAEESSYFLDFFPAIRATHHAAESYNNDIYQLVLLLSVDTWVFNVIEVFNYCTVC